MKNKEEQTMNISQANEEIVAIYSYYYYYYTYVQRIEEAPRRKALLKILLQVAAKLYGPETGMSLGFRLLENSKYPVLILEAERGEYKEG